MKPIRYIVLLLGILLSRQIIAATPDGLEKYIVPLPGEHGLAMFRAESLGLRSTGGSVPRNWDIFLVTQDNRKDLQRVTNMQFWDCGGLDVSPDGRNIVFSASVNQYPKDSFLVLRTAALIQIAPQSKKYVGGTVLVDNGKNNVSPRYSPDGRHVVFLAQSQRPRTFGETLLPPWGTVQFLWEVCIIDLQTREVTVVDKSNDSIEQHGFSTDGTLILYTKEGQVRTRPLAGIKTKANE